MLVLAAAAGGAGRTGRWAWKRRQSRVMCTLVRGGEVPAGLPCLVGMLQDALLPATQQRHFLMPTEGARHWHHAWLMRVRRCIACAGVCHPSPRAAG